MWRPAVDTTLEEAAARIHSTGLEIDVTPFEWSDMSATPFSTRGSAALLIDEPRISLTIAYEAAADMRLEIEATPERANKHILLTELDLVSFEAIVQAIVREMLITRLDAE